MRFARLIVAGVRHHARALVGVVLGCAVATAVLAGALVVGDSVRASLRRVALDRIGQVDAALAAHDRFFRADLGDSLEFGVRTIAPVPMDRLRTAAVIALDGVAITDGGARRVNDARVYGVDDQFFGLARTPLQPPLLGADDALVSAPFARRLGLAVGDTVLVRVEKPSGLPRDMALATTDDLTIPLRLTVRGVVDDASFGRFGLAANQVPPANVFVARTHLAERLELRGRANLLLADLPDGSGGAGVLDEVLPLVWSLDDGELEIVLRAEQGVAELRSRRVFIDPPVEAAIRAMDEPALGILTYFVNAIEAGDGRTPYSTVSAVGRLDRARDTSDPGDLPALAAALAPEPGTITLNAWAAEDLAVRTGDAVEIRAFVIGADRRLDETTAAFTVGGVTPIVGFAADPELMPAFPGLADSEHCRDWEAGIPIDLAAIRDRDEAYWDEHRGTPKAFIALEDGQAAWGSRFGALTAVRVPIERAEAFGTALGAAVPPAVLGLSFTDLRAQALAASGGTTDFGGLFIGLSLFLIVSAVVLTAMLFTFSIEARAAEIGTLLAIGFRPRAVRRIFLLEALVLGGAGAVLGVLGAVAYAQLVLRGLGGVWADAVGGTVGGVDLELAVRPATLAVGAAGALLVALGAIWLAIRRQVRRPAAELLRPGAGTLPPAHRRGPRRRVLRRVVAVIGTLGAAALVISTDPGRGPAAAGAFFGAGTLLLVAGLAACAMLLERLERGATAAVHTVAGLGQRNAVRRPGRSLGVVVLVAAGTFLVVAVGANRLGGIPDPLARSSGTGGFALMGTAALPVLHDPTAPDGLDAYGLDAAELSGVSVVPMRVREGDEASCLNLNAAQRPRLLGVDPALLAARDAFTFASTIEPVADGASPWMLLQRDAGSAGIGDDGAVPAIGDMNSLLWALHKKVGDTITYTDERGAEFQVRIVGAVANSVLQGNLLIARDAFEERFPSEPGARMLLVDAPADRVELVSAALSRGMADIGLALEPAADRLEAFNAVQNTYLLIFQMLGGLGLVLGSAGLAVVVLRNVLERRAELAALRAIGWRRGLVRRLVLSEHVLLLGLGLGLGVAAALVAVLPALRGPGLAPPWGLTAAVVGAVALGGMLWTWAATALATASTTLDALRAE